MGIAIARAARSRGWPTTLLLGPVSTTVPESLDPIRFETTHDLARLLDEQWPRHDMLIMAAAVSDYRPDLVPPGKIRHAGDLVLTLEPTEDLLASLADRSRPGQVRIGFALEDSQDMIERARAKLRSKQLDAIVANPLATMDADIVNALLIDATSTSESPANATKDVFADWLLETVASRYSPGIVETTPVQGLDAEA